MSAPGRPGWTSLASLLLGGSDCNDRCRLSKVKVVKQTAWEKGRKGNLGKFVPLPGRVCASSHFMLTTLLAQSAAKRSHSVSSLCSSLTTRQRNDDADDDDVDYSEVSAICYPHTAAGKAEKLSHILVATNGWNQPKQPATSNADGGMPSEKQISFLFNVRGEKGEFPHKKKGKKHSPRSESLWTIKQNGTMHRHAIFRISLEFAFVCFSLSPPALEGRCFASRWWLFKMPFQPFLNSSWAVNSQWEREISEKEHWLRFIYGPWPLWTRHIECLALFTGGLFANWMPYYHIEPAVTGSSTGKNNKS